MQVEKPLLVKESSLERNHVPVHSSSMLVTQSVFAPLNSWLQLVNTSESPPGQGEKQFAWPPGNVPPLVYKAVVLVLVFEEATVVYNWVKSKKTSVALSRLNREVM